MTLTTERLATCAAQSPVGASVLVRLERADRPAVDLVADAVEYSPLSGACEITVYLPPGWTIEPPRPLTRPYLDP